jgi:hypothetical protein
MTFTIFSGVGIFLSLPGGLFFSAKPVSSEYLIHILMA